MGRRFTDEVDTVRVDFLRAYGLLGDSPAKLECTWKTRPGDKVLFEWNPGKSVLVVRQKRRRQLITVLRNCGAPRPTLFLCPLSGSRCTDLFVEGSGIGSRDVLGLNYRSTSLGATKRMVWKRQHGGLLPPYVPNDPSPSPFSKLAPKPARAKPRTRTRTNAWDTRTALRNADGLAAEERELIRQREAQLRSMALTAPTPLQASTLRSGIFEQHPRLELNALREEGLVVEAACTLGVAVWDNDRTELVGAAFFVDLTEGASPYIAIESWASGQPVFQRIQLSEPDKSTRKRRHFLCPVTGKKVESLAFRAGRWASMKAQALKNQSQRSARFRGHDAVGYRDLDKSEVGQTKSRRQS